MELGQHSGDVKIWKYIIKNFSGEKTALEA